MTFFRGEKEGKLTIEGGGWMKGEGTDLNKDEWMKQMKGNRLQNYDNRGSVLYEKYCINILLLWPSSPSAAKVK